MKRYAFVLGRNGPAAHKLDTLQYAESDALKVAKVLDGGVAGFDEVAVFDEGESARENLERFEKLAERCGYDDVLLFYFSGHGHNPRGELFLLFPETNLDRLVTTALPINAIKTVMAQSKARVRIIILDCCHSGAAGNETMRSSHRPQELPLVEAARSSASIIVAACGRNVVTRESGKFGGGFLTHLLVRALGDDLSQADIDQDGLVSITDFIEWASRQTAKANKRALTRAGSWLEAPEVYGDFRSQVYLTASRFVMRDDELAEEVRQQVAHIREVFSPRGRLEFKELQNLARPIASKAPTFTNLKILEELFEQEDDAAIFAAAVILRVRRDPNYMSRLIGYVDAGRLRGAANWRVLRAIRDTTSRYEFTDSGRRDFVRRLREAARQRATQDRPQFGRGTCLTMIKQIIQRLEIPAEDVFSQPQLKLLKKASRRRRKTKSR